MEKEKKISLLKDFKTLSLIGMIIFPYSFIMLFIGYFHYDSPTHLYISLVCLGVGIAFAIAFFVLRKIISKQAE